MLRCYFGDSREVLRSVLKTERFALLISSPPYPYWDDHAMPINEERDMVQGVLAAAFERLMPGAFVVLETNDHNAGKEHGILNISSILSRDVRLAARSAKRSVAYKGTVLVESSGVRFPRGSFPQPCGILPVATVERWLVFKMAGKRGGVPIKVREKSALLESDFAAFKEQPWASEVLRQDSVSEGGSFISMSQQATERFIRFYSYYRDTVLDPFVGTGTTLAAAAMTGRNGVGIEINKNYLPDIKRRMPLTAALKIKTVK